MKAEHLKLASQLWSLGGLKPESGSDVPGSHVSQDHRIKVVSQTRGVKLQGQGESIQGNGQRISVSDLELGLVKLALTLCDSEHNDILRTLMCFRLGRPDR